MVWRSASSYYFRHYLLNSEFILKIIISGKQLEKLKKYYF